MLLIGTDIGITNGYYQTTKIVFEDIEEPCYATLLSRYTVSGTWSTKLEYDLNAPEEVINFFDEYQDSDHYFYLNYFQDVTEGLLYWPYYPPDDFKLLMFFPQDGSFIVSDEIYHRYALTSTYKAKIADGHVVLTRNYDYPRMIVNTTFRIVLSTLLSVLVILLFARPLKSERKFIIFSTFIFQVILNLLISYYSFLHGFSMVEYYLFIWLAYLPFALLQGYLFSRKAYSMVAPYRYALLANVAAYALGMFLVDNFPGLFTIA